MNSYVKVGACLLLMVAVCCGLLGCGDYEQTAGSSVGQETAVDSEQEAIQEATSLFDAGDYEGALDKFKSISTESQNTTNVASAEFQCATALYEAGQYSLSKDYFLHLLESESDSVNEEECRNYLQLCYAMDSLNSGSNTLYRTYQVIEMSEDGFEPASKVLEPGGPFADRAEMLKQHSGLYRSEETIKRTYSAEGYELGSNDCYSYISIQDGIYATTLVAEGAVISMDSETARERAKDNEFSCSTWETENGAFWCSAKYTNAITGDSYKVTFDLVFEPESIVISNLSSTEPSGGELFREGRYLKIG